VKRFLKIRAFTRWMRKTELTDKALVDAAKEMEQGLIDADLGGNVYKKRVPLPHRGKRGSVRILVAARMQGHLFFMFGFEKTEKDNIDDDESAFLKKQASKLLALDDSQIDALIESGHFQEITL
jgi:hypothetical protein